MCLAVPGRLIAIDAASHDVRMGTVEFGGIRRRVCLEHVPDATAGKYVLVHVGYALTVIDEDEAMRMLTLLRELGESEGEDA